MRIATLKIIFFVFLICSFFGVSYSQVYPVQVSTQLLPPYSSYLPDYGDPANEKLKCILVLQDFSVTHRDVKLEIKITGNGFTIQTSPQYLPPPITLTPGVPVLITASDLAPYLATQNLVFTGLNAADYELRKILPEGYYSVCIKAVDYYNSNYTVVSNESCNSAWFFLNDPPYLNFPSCEEEITPVTPQNIIFQWTAMNLNSPNSVLGTEYDFELFEIRPNNGIPNNVVQNSAPVFSITTTQPFFQYSITEPALYLGMKYVWRVRARDLSGRDLFKNDGWSQICTFTYGNINSAFPEDAFTLTLNATASTHRQGKVWWNHIANFTQYHVQVRKTGTQNWFDYYTADPDLKINELEPSVSYEARVMGTGSNLESDWSNTASFTTPVQPEYGCNDQTQPINALASNPLMVAYAGMIFQIGQFEMRATQITPDPGAPGFYSGYGVIKMYMVNINVAYNHVFINDNLQITSGSVNAITDGMESWENEWLIEQENAYFPDSNVDSIIFNNDTSGIHVYTDNGDSLYYEFPGMGHPIVINEPSGVQYIVWPDGNIDTASWLILSDDYLDADTETKILFSASEDQQYGFDPYEHPEWFEEYETIKLIDDSHYFVSNKSLKISGSDFVLADYKGEELIFTTGGGEILTAVLENNKYKISLQNFSEDGVVYAMQETQRLGKLNVKVYEELEKEVVLVRVGEVAMPESSLILQELNKTYQSGIVKWNVSVSQGYTAANWDENANGKVDIDDYSLLNKYSDEMDKIRNAFSDENVSDDAYVLFVIDGFGDVSVNGYMPYGRRYGFIKAGSAAKTYAHELGHGSFGLQHTFPTVAQGTTNNLMDYGSGKNLAGWQWDWMREGHWLENILAQQSPYILVEEELVGTATGDLSEFGSIPAPKAIYTPSGKFISTGTQVLNLSDVKFDFVSGGLYSFTYEGQGYQSLFCKTNSGQNIFCCYVKVDCFERLKKYWKDILRPTGLTEAYLNSIKIDYEQFITYIKENPSDVFINFEWARKDDEGVGNFFNVYGSVGSIACSSALIQWALRDNNITKTAISHFDENNRFIPVLWGDIKILTGEDIPSENGQYLVSYRPFGNMFSTADSANNEIDNWYCRLISVFDRNGWGKFYLQQTLSKAEITYYDIKNIYDDNQSYLRNLITISEVYDNEGRGFVNRIKNSITDQKSLDLLYKLMTTNIEYDLYSDSFDSMLVKSELKHRIERFNENLAILNGNNEADMISIALHGMQTEELSLLDLETRIRVLAILSNATMRGNVNLMGEDEEGGVIKLIATIPESDYRSFLSQLKSTIVESNQIKNTLLFNLDYEFNDTEYFDADGNFGRFHQLLIQMAFAVHGKGKNADQLFKTTQAGSVLYLGMGEGCYFHISETQIVSGNIDLQYEMDCTWSGSFMMFLNTLSAIFNSDEQKYFELQSVQESQNFNYDPFEDWVLIIPYADNTDLGLEKGKPVMLPAIGAHFLFKEKENQASRFAFRTVLNLVSLATGLTSLGAGHLARVIEIIDITTTSADLTLDLFSEDLRGLLGEDNYNALRTGTGIIQLAGIGGLGVIKTAQLVDNLPKFATNIKSLSWSFEGITDVKAAALRRVLEVFGGNSTGLESKSDDIINFYNLDRALESKYIVEQYDLVKYGVTSTIDEVAAIHRYTVNNFELTIASYSNNFTDIQKSWINLINSGLNKMRALKQFSGTVYRGSNLTESRLQRYLDAWNSSEKTITESPFLSASKNPLVASDFIYRFGLDKPTSIEVTFIIKTKSGVDIDEISDYGKNLQPYRHEDYLIQEEVILPQNLSYKIDDIPTPTVNSINGKTQYLIYMTEL
jgi:hypothetical protein